MSLLVRIIIAIFIVIIGAILVGLLVGTGVFGKYSELVHFLGIALVVIGAIWEVVAGATWFGGTRV